MKNRNLWLTLGAIILIVLVVLIGTRVFKKPASEENVIKIGAILPLTGNAGVPGNRILEGLKLALKDKEDKIIIITEDSKSSVKDGVSAYQKILNFNKPDIIIVGLSSIAKAILKDIDQYKIITIITQSNYPRIAEKLNYGVRFFVDAENEVKLLIRFLNNRDIKKIGIVYMEDEGSYGVYNLIKDRYKREISFVESFKKDEFNFRNIVSKIKSKNCEAIIAIGFGPSLGNLILQIRESGIKVPIISTMTMGSQDAKEAAKDAFYKDVYFTTPYFEFNKDTLTELFKKEYKYVYKKDADFLSAIGYDLGSLIKKYLVDQNYKFEKNTFLSYLKNLDYYGISGRIKADIFNNIQPQVIIVSFKSPESYKIYYENEDR